MQHTTEVKQAVWSASRLGTLIHSPMAWYLRYVLGAQPLEVPRESPLSSPAATFGSLWGACCAAADVYGTDRAVTHARTAGSVLPDTGVWSTDVLASWAAQYRPEPIDFAERHLEVTVDGVRWQAYADATAGSCWIERKATRDPMADSERYWQSVQLRTYEVLATEAGFDELELQVLWLARDRLHAERRPVDPHRVREWRGIMSFWLDTATFWVNNAIDADRCRLPWRPVLSDWEGEHDGWWHRAALESGSIRELTLRGDHDCARTD